MATSTIKNSYANNAGKLNNILTVKVIELGPSATKNITLSSGTRCLLISDSTPNAHKGMWIIGQGSTTGIVPVLSAANVGIDTSVANTLKVTNGSTTTAVYLYFLIFNGSVSV